MKIVQIGSSGHYGYTFEYIKKNKFDFCGIAPRVNPKYADAYTKENITGCYKHLTDDGFDPRLYDDYIEMLDNVKPDIAVVNSIYGINSQISCEALQRGINVYSDKPLATELDKLYELKEIYETINKTARVSITLMLEMRYEPTFYTAKTIVDSGGIGDIRLINAQKSYRLGTRPAFYTKRELMGGLIPWIAIHGIDLTKYYCPNKIIDIKAFHSKKSNSGYGDLEVSSMCLFEFENEVIASVSADFLRPQNAPSHGDDRVRIVGDKGIVEVRNGQVYLINSTSNGTEPYPLINPGYSIFSTFADEVMGKGRCVLPFEDAFEVTEIALKSRNYADKL